MAQGFPLGLCSGKHLWGEGHRDLLQGRREESASADKVSDWGTAADLGVPTSPCLHRAALTESMLKAIKGVSRQLELLVSSPLIPVVMALGP